MIVLQFGILVSANFIEWLVVYRTVHFNVLYVQVNAEIVS